MRHRGSWTFEVLAVVAALGSGLGCGDDEPARDQAVVWMQLGAAFGQDCLSARSFSLPDDDARTVLTGDSGTGARLVDGSGGRIECTVTEGAPGQFNLAFNLESGEIGSFNVSGPLTKPADADGEGTFVVFFNTTSFRLEQQGCTATVKQALPGAVWISSLNCSDLEDRSSPGISCTGEGGLIAENCAR